VRPSNDLPREVSSGGRGAASRVLGLEVDSSWLCREPARARVPREGARRGGQREVHGQSSLGPARSNQKWPDACSQLVRGRAAPVVVQMMVVILNWKGAAWVMGGAVSCHAGGRPFVSVPCMNHPLDLYHLSAVCRSPDGTRARFTSARVAVSGTHTRCRHTRGGRREGGGDGDGICYWRGGMMSRGMM